MGNWNHRMWTYRKGEIRFAGNFLVLICIVFFFFFSVFNPWCSILAYTSFRAAIKSEIPSKRNEKVYWHHHSIVWQEFPNVSFHGSLTSSRDLGRKEILQTVWSLPCRFLTVKCIIFLLLVTICCFIAAVLFICLYLWKEKMS